MVKNIETYLDYIQKRNNLTEWSPSAALAAISPWMSGLMAATMIMRYASTFINDYMTKQGRACNHLVGASKNLCIVDYKIRGLELQKNTLKSKQSLCNKSRDRRACREKIQKKIDVIDRQLRDLYEHKDIFREKARKERQAQMRIM